MISNSERTAHFYDFEIATQTAGVRVPSMLNLLEAVEQQWKLQPPLIDVSRGIKKLTIRDVQIDQGRELASILVVISDKTAPNAVYSDLTTADYTVHQKRGDEGNEVGVHVVISLRATTPGTPSYLAMIEAVPGLSHSIVRRAINNTISTFHKSNGNAFEANLQSGAKKRDGSPRKKRYLPRIDLHAYVSEQFIKEIEHGKINSISLFQSVLNPNVGGVSYLKKIYSEVRVKVDGQLPSTNLWKSLMGAFKKEASNTEKVKISFTQMDGQAKTIDIDPVTGSPILSKYVKSVRYSKITPFLESSSMSLVPHLVSRMESSLLAER